MCPLRGPSDLIGRVEVLLNEARHAHVQGNQRKRVKTRAFARQQENHVEVPEHRDSESSRGKAGIRGSVTALFLAMQSSKIFNHLHLACKAYVISALSCETLKKAGRV